MRSIIDICFLKFISHYIKEILYVNTNSVENQSWNKNKEIYIFTFFGCRVKIPYLQFLFFLSFMNIFKTHKLEMLFKIGALKIYVILQLCKTVCCFPVKIAKFWRTVFLKTFSGGCFSIIFKLIKQLFRNGVNINKFLNKCPCYDVLVTFFLSTFYRHPSFDV